MYKGEIRSPGMMILLSIVTCSIYYYIWLWKTKDDINGLLNREEIPSYLVILAIFIPFVDWFIWYKVHTAFEQEVCPQKSVAYSSNNFLLWVLLAVLAGIGTFFAIFQIQETLNKIWNNTPDNAIQA